MSSQYYLSDLEYTERYGTRYMDSEDSKVLVIYFSLSCEHCIYQLNVIDKHILELRGVKIYLITSENNLFTSNFMEKFKNLKDSETVHFGIIDIERCKIIDESIVVPTIFFFNKLGQIHSKICGEAKIEKIIKTLEKVDVRPASE